MCEFAPGVHIYVGSAHGPGGLRARVMRHLRAGKLQHWHIDYLTACAMPMQIIWEVGAPRRECEWLQRILALPGAYAPISGFGSSDCLAHCPAHLVALSQTPDLANTLCLVLA
jgi:Uri superfamily endonuclease